MLTRKFCLTKNPIFDIMTVEPLEGFTESPSKGGKKLREVPEVRFIFFAGGGEVGYWRKFCRQGGEFCSSALCGEPFIYRRRR